MCPDSSLPRDGPFGREISGPTACANPVGPCRVYCEAPTACTTSSGTAIELVLINDLTGFKDFVPIGANSLYRPRNTDEVDGYG